MDLTGWTPIRVHDREPPAVEWSWLDGIEFDDPFFVDSVERALRTPFSLLFRQETPIDVLDGLEPRLAPTGFVLHGSRCGSTLVSRMLAAVPRHLVLSEPPPVDQLLRARATGEDRVRWLRGLVSALGRPRHAGQDAYVLKLDAWSTRSLGTLRTAFPGVPWVFVFRDPVQVLASHARHRGAHMVPGAIDPRLFAIDPDEIVRIPHEEYCARVLASIYASALEHRDGALFVDYAELPGAVVERILPAFGLDCDDEELARMQEAAGRDAKNPTTSFQPQDLPATPELRAAAERWVRPVYEELLAC